MFRFYKCSISLQAFFPRIILFAVLLKSCIAETSSPEPETLPNLPHTDTDFNSNEQENILEEQTYDIPHTRIRPPYLSSPVHLTKLAQTEQHVYEVVTHYENQLLERLQILQRYRMDYEDSTIQGLIQSGQLDSPDGWAKSYVVSSNPLLAFRMIHRFTKDLPLLTEHIWKSLESELWETLEDLKGDFDWPSENDLMSATKSLIKLQDTHDFNMDYFTDGVMRDHPVKVGITGQQSLEISQTALALGDVTAATEWLQVAQSRAIHGRYKEPLQNYVPVDELKDSLERTHKAFQDIWPMSIFKTHDVFAEAKTLLQEDFDRMKLDLNFENRHINFKALCRGDKLKSEAEIAKLICFNDHTFHPYLYLNPLKVEIHNWEPLIYQVHDFLGEWTMHDMSISAVSSVTSTVESGSAQAQNDFTTFTWSLLDEGIIPVFRKLTEKLSALVGLVDSDREGGSSYQISAYAVGNHYEPCFDCFNFKVNANGSENNQMKTEATAHAVLHEPEQGGELAFTLTGTLVKALRGSLIIYYNLNPATKEPDERILHGSCPVLIGQKWMATKLISSDH